MQLGRHHLDLARPQLVGILNLTPDSFSDGGQFFGGRQCINVEAALRKAESLVRAGADLLDLGGESTRPGAEPVSPDVERDRVLPALTAIASRIDIPLSIDTRRAEVAQPALAAGASMVNDVSGFGDPGMGALVAATGAAWVLMHMPHPIGQMGWSRAVGAMPQETAAGLQQVADDLAAAVVRAEAAGVQRHRLVVDPGLGFGKTLLQNLALLRPGGPLGTLDLPIYLGPSRKSFLAAACRLSGRGDPSSGVDPQDRLAATAAAVAMAVLAGAAFVRVHDVAAMRQALDVALAVRDAG